MQQEFQKYFNHEAAHAKFIAKMESGETAQNPSQTLMNHFLVSKLYDYALMKQKTVYYDFGFESCQSILKYIEQVHNYINKHYDNVYQMNIYNPFLSLLAKKKEEGEEVPSSLEELYSGGKPEILFLGKTLEDGFLYLDLNCNSSLQIRLYGYECDETSAHRDFFRKIHEEITENSEKENKERNKFFIFSLGQRGDLRIDQIEMPVFSFTESNYSKITRESYAYVLKELPENNPNGRIVIVSGPPGTGKTYLVRSFISESENCCVILVPNTMITGLESPQLLTTLVNFKEENMIEGEKIVFVIEDADVALGSRKDHVGDVLSVTSILNLSDGIIGDSLGVRVIATTNLENVEFDEAITRPGRLLKHIEIGRLDPIEASEAFEKITEGRKHIFMEPKTLAEIYAEANDYISQMPQPKPAAKKKKIGFGFDCK